MLIAVAPGVAGRDSGTSVPGGGGGRGAAAELQWSLAKHGEREEADSDDDDERGRDSGGAVVVVVVVVDQLPVPGTEVKNGDTRVYKIEFVQSMGMYTNGENSGYTFSARGPDTTAFLAF
ncbi:hypothetical protein APHAL10511_000358 [Amanita phalloides]|nr:hypothetical protein APHAL10511_000358 [Amanita phalloides]